MIGLMKRFKWRQRASVAVAMMAVCVVGVLTAALSPPAAAQGTSVEELERRLQKAKEEKARRDAAAAKTREEAEAERKRKEAEAGRAAAERRAQEARQANLVVQTDAPCTLFVNGRETAQLPKGITEVKVSPGQKLVSCASSEEKTTFEDELEARSGQDTVLRIALAGKVAEVRNSRAAADGRARAEAAWLEQALRDRNKPQLALANMKARLQSVSYDVLFDSKLGLQWTRSDNRDDINWGAAQSYCRGLGEGWELPTSDQLQSLYDAALPGVRCGTKTCKVSDQLRLSAWQFWSSQRGSSDASFVLLDNGGWGEARLDYGQNLRALCVRRP